MEYLNNEQHIEKLIQENERLIYKQMHKLNVGYDDDAYSHGMEALYKAIITFEDDKDIAFSTYATVCIYNGICMYLRKSNKAIDKLTFSYDATINEDGTSFIEFIEDDICIEEDFISSEATTKIYSFIQRAYENENNPTKKAVLKEWIGSGFMITNSEVGKKIGCSQSYVSRIIIDFRKRLKAYLKTNN